MANNEKNRKVAPDLSDTEAERLLCETMRHLGWLIPQTVTDVELTEQQMAQKPVTLPLSLQDPFAVLDGGAPGLPAPSCQPPIDPAAVENLACAARNGGDVPPEVRARMDLDRRRAEKEQGDGRQQ